MYILPDYIQNALRNKSELTLSCDKDFYILQEQIKEVTKENIGKATLRRLFGRCQSSVNKPHKYTLTIIAWFLGYDSWNIAVNKLNPLEYTLSA